VSKKDICAILDAVSEVFELDPVILRVFARIESNFNPKAQNPQTLASGLFQFLKSTAAEYHIDPFDVREAAVATAMMIRRNRDILVKRDVPENVANLYLCHQQGRTGFLQIWRAAHEEGTALPQVRHRTMQANLPAQERRAYAQLTTDAEKAAFFINHWNGKISKFLKEIAG